MEQTESQWLRTLEKYGITGDVCSEIRRKAKEISDTSPASVFSYATWQACAELSHYFNDEQGIPIEESSKINQFTAGPLKRLIESGGLGEENQGAVLALRELIVGLHEIRRK